MSDALHDRRPRAARGAPPAGPDSSSSLLTVVFLALFGLAVREVFRRCRQSTERGSRLDEQTLAGATLLGLRMFVDALPRRRPRGVPDAGAVRGDAERGLLQPLVVRPVGRTTLLLARFAGGVGRLRAYVDLVFLVAVVITGATGDCGRPAPASSRPGAGAAVVSVVAVSLLGSTVLSTTANGIAVFMVFGAGLAAGLLGQVGEALSLGHAARHRVDRVLGAAVRGALPVRRCTR